MKKKSKYGGAKTPAAAILVAAILVALYLFFDIDLVGFENYAEPTARPNVTAAVTAKTASTPRPGATADLPDEPIRDGEQEFEPELSVPFTVKNAPKYKGQPYATVHGGVPYFDTEAATVEAFEVFSPLDERDRCGTVFANVCRELMPTEKRESIYHIKPSGWVSVQYDHVDGLSLYNRCHLLGFQLTGENDNEKNLITGTRSLNTQGMLPFENLIADYVKETDNHVLYRVTPIFKGDELVARGVLMEGWSVEDEGDGVCFCVYAFNVEPGVTIDYATGESRLSE